jgi:hypothetical protein
LTGELGESSDKDISSSFDGKLCGEASLGSLYVWILSSVGIKTDVNSAPAPFNSGQFWEKMAITISVVEHTAKANRRYARKTANKRFFLTLGNGDGDFMVV